MIVGYSVADCARQRYTSAESHAVRAWLRERVMGYPTLAKFEGGEQWPVLPRCAACEGATFGHDRQPHA